MRQSWTDDRLDDLAGRMDAGFNRVDANFDKVDASFEKVEARFEKVDAGFKDVRHEIAEQGQELRGEIQALGERFDRFQNTIFAGFVSIFVTLIAALIMHSFT